MVQSRKVRLNKTVIQAVSKECREEKKQVEFTDLELTGFGINVGKTGNVSFFIRYVIGGRRKRFTIGKFPAMTVQQAKGKAMSLLSEVLDGCDPRGEDSTANHLTFREFTENQYLPYAKDKKRSYTTDVSKLETHLYDVFGGMKLQQISRKDIEGYLHSIEPNLSGATVNRHHALLGAIFRKAEDWELIDKSPVRGIEKRKEKARDRYLSDAEQQAFLKGLDYDFNRVAALLLKFLLVTGARLGEAQNAQWKYIDLNKKTWFIPMTKNGESRTVVLNPVAVEILGELASMKVCQYVFPGKSDDKPISRPTKAFQRVCDYAGIKEFRIHDLRHTFASIAVNEGVNLYEVQRLLGHKSHIMTQRYAHISSDRLESASNVVAESIRNAA